MAWQGKTYVCSCWGSGVVCIREQRKEEKREKRNEKRKEKKESEDNRSGVE